MAHGSLNAQNIFPRRLPTILIKRLDIGLTNDAMNEILMVKLTTHKHAHEKRTPKTTNHLSNFGQSDSFVLRHDVSTVPQKNDKARKVFSCALLFILNMFFRPQSKFEQSENEIREKEHIQNVFRAPLPQFKPITQCHCPSITKFRKLLLNTLSNPLSNALSVHAFLTKVLQKIPKTLVLLTAIAAFTAGYDVFVLITST